MANLTKLEFAALDISGKNYLPWTLDVEIHLTANNLGETIKDENNGSPQERAKAMIFLRHHLHEGLKAEYLTVKDPLELWKNLKERYDHQKQVILPKARYEWIHLRLQDFKSVSEYNSAMFRISSELKLCGEIITDNDMLEKTFSTFHASNMLLQQQYRERGFKKYSELISCLLVAEQNNELLMKNHQARPTSSTPFPEVNEANHKRKRDPFPEANAASYNRKRGRGRGRAYGRGQHQGHGHGRGRSHRGGHDVNANNDGRNARGNQVQNPPKKYENACYKCGMTNHWSRICRTPKHLVDLYQASLKKKEGAEMNLVENNQDGMIMDTHLDISDFLLNDDNIDVFVNDGNVHQNA